MRLLALSTTGTISVAKGSRAVFCSGSAPVLSALPDFKAIRRTSCVPAQYRHVTPEHEVPVLLSGVT